MTHHNHLGHGIGAALLVGAVAFAFGFRTARVLVGAVLVAGALFFVYVLARVIMGTI